jgi:3'-phosphoadenosine 5'-phosphosulfate sulfotransferase (PAPS reductase)/FAD synthetase
VHHLVSLSGGHDSTALALHLLEVEPREYEYVCTPTGNELPEMYAHWRLLGELLGKPILPVMATTLGARIEKYNTLPNGRMRWCTKELKLKPFSAYCATIGEGVAYVGLRADEPERTGATGMYDAVGMNVRYPLREWGWGEAEVQAYLATRGVEVPERTDCAVCFFQRLSEWYQLWLDHPEEYAKGEAWEEITGHTFRSKSRDSWPAALREMRLMFEQGAVPRGAGAKLFSSNGSKCRVCSM